jgi:hypothetical protein
MPTRRSTHVPLKVPRALRSITSSSTSMGWATARVPWRVHATKFSTIVLLSYSIITTIMYGRIYTIVVYLQLYPVPRYLARYAPDNLISNIHDVLNLLY